MARVGFKKRISPGRVIGKVVMVLVGLWTLDTLVGVLRTALDTSNATGTFYQVYQFLGVNEGTQGLLLIAGIMLGVSAVLGEVIDIN